MRDKAIFRTLGKQGFAGHVATIGALILKSTAAVIEARAHAVAGTQPGRRL